MNAVFLACLVAYMAVSIWTNRAAPSSAARPGPRWSIALQSPLLLLACVIAWERGILSRDLVSPVHIAGGLLAGHLLFGVSVLCTHRVLHDAFAHVVDLRPLGRFIKENPPLLFRFAAVSFTEELIYRVAAQSLLLEWTGRPAAAIAITAAMFCVVHGHFFRNPFAQSLEFAGFALLLGVLYHWTGSFVLVLVIHTIRNLEIVYLEFLVKVEELGGESAAQAAIEAEYAARGPEAA